VNPASGPAARWRDVVRHWGTTPEERARPFPCDALMPDADSALYRGVDVRAPASLAFRWLCQLRVAPYSYDWIDNGGRQSPPERTPGLDALAPGQAVMRIFDLVSFEPDVHLTLRLRRPGLFPTLAVSYLVVPQGPERCRILVKLALRQRAGLADRIARAVLPTGDFIMMRRQLLNLAALAARDFARGAPGQIP
jgi:hypothetical protein